MACSSRSAPGLRRVCVRPNGGSAPIAGRAGSSITAGHSSRLSRPRRPESARCSETRVRVASCCDQGAEMKQLGVAVCVTMLGLGACGGGGDSTPTSETLAKKLQDASLCKSTRPRHEGSTRRWVGVCWSFRPEGGTRVRVGFQDHEPSTRTRDRLPAASVPSNP